MRIRQQIRGAVRGLTRFTDLVPYDELCDDLVLREKGRLGAVVCGSEQLADEAGVYDSEVVALKRIRWVS